MRKVLAIDFEFNRSQEPNVYPVSVSLKPYIVKEHKGTDTGRILPQGLTETYWLRSRIPYEEAKTAILKYIAEGYCLLCFAGIAEARAMNAMGLDDPKLYKMFDLYVLFRQLSHTWKKYKYGRYPSNGRIFTSIPPRYTPKGDLVPGDYNQIKPSLAGACCHTLGLVIDKKEKDEVRDLIISDPPKFTEAQKKRILEYNESDILHLPNLLTIQLQDFATVTGMSWDRCFDIMLYHGEYIKAIAAQEDEGIPLNTEGVFNLSHNHVTAVNDLIENLNAIYPFFIKVKNKWVRSYAQFRKYLIENNLAKGWPKTKCGKYATDEDTLDAYQYGDAKNALVSYSQTVRSIGNIVHFSKNAKGQMLKNIGSDGRMRTWLAPFGTLTGRNAPKPSKGFIPAMARWTRSLINPEEGHIIQEFDWSGQEFIVAASLSGDMNMVQAYMSGDPYVWLAKKAGAIPPEGTKKTHPLIRTAFKSLTLGIGFGMQAKSLAVKLTMDTGKVYTEAMAQALIDTYERIFKTYAKWKVKVKVYYKINKVIILRDGWCLLPDNKSPLSTANQPVQGTAACMFRNACITAYHKRMPVIYGLHDALRDHVKKAFAEANRKMMLEIMAGSVAKFLKHEIRNSGKVVEHGIPYIEEGAEEMYKIMGKYIENRLYSNEEQLSEEIIDLEFDL